MKLPKNKLWNIFVSCFYISLEQINLNKDIKYIDNFIKKNKSKYFLIISGTPLYLSKKTRNSNNFILVQHSDYKVYDKFYFYNQLNYGKHSFLYKNLLLILNGAFFKDKSVLKKTKNVVFYSNEKKYLEINKNLLVGSIPIEEEFFNKDHNYYLNKKQKNSIVYFGRFDNGPKNLELLSNIASMGNLNIDLYGYGEYEIELRKNSLLHVKGKILNVNDKINILSKYDIFIVTSNYEGICISAIELLSMGIIGIIRDSYLEAKNLIPKQYHDFLLIKSNANVDEYINKINNIKNMTEKLKNKMRVDLMNHIQSVYSVNIFENNWNVILKKVKR